MDVKLEVDYRALPLDQGDSFLLTTDGIHDFLSTDDLERRTRTASEHADGDGFESACHEMIAAALERGSDDNLSCQLLRIDDLAHETADDAIKKLTELPFPPPLEPGMSLDGLTIEHCLHESTRSQLYVVRDPGTGRRLVMKTPSVNFEDDPAYIDRFIMESWIGSRIENAHVVRNATGPMPPTHLYILQEHIRAQTLGAWMQTHPSPEIGEVVDILDQVAAGLRALHRRETLHQDLKPDNVLVDADGHVTLVDFGSCHVAGIHEIATPIERDRVLGTASYSAPELRLGVNAGVRSELFSLGTLAYEMLTGALPYGEAIESIRSTRGAERLEYRPSYHINPMIPVWLDGALRTAVRTDPARRYGDLSEFLYDLRHPNPIFAADVPLPLIERNPLRFWQAATGAMVVLNGILLWWLFGS